MKKCPSQLFSNKPMLFGRKPASVSWLVVFLGNPGPKYASTRHNAGFMVAEAFEKKHGVRINRLKFNALTALSGIGGEKVLLMKPQTFMNLSGRAVKPASDFYKIPPERILVISDDVSLPLGVLRIRRKGSAGGHNGLKDIIEKCGEDFPRLKIGVGSPQSPDYEMADWVLSSLKNSDAETMASAAVRAADAVSSIITGGIEGAMNIYNR